MIGPSIPPTLLSSARSETPDSPRDETTDKPSTSQSTFVGPQIPPQSSARSPQPAGISTSHDEDQDEDEDDYVPQLPPDMLAARASTSTPAGSVARKVIGPTFPPPFGTRTYDEDDDDYGPTPLPAGAAPREKDAVEEFLEKEERRRKQLEEASKPKALQRDEWMLVPPSSSDLLASIDPTKLNRPRQFARSAAPSRNTDTSLWTETPAERQQRIADEVSGKRRRVTDVDAISPDEERELRKRRRNEEEVRRGVEEHTRKVRGGTLLNQHAQTSSKQDQTDEDDGPPKIWDHSRDMALSGRLMDDKSRDKFIREARGLGDRFGSGKSGGFL